jgi:hypothetical protein
MQLPDEPFVEFRPEKEAMVPQRAIELVGNRIHKLEVIANVQNDLPPPGSFDQLDEVPELLVDLRWTGSGAAVSGQLEIDSRGKGVALGRNDVEEMASLVRAGRAQSEVVVGPPNQSRFFRSAPVLIETRVGEVAALGGFDVGERNAIEGYALPIDDLLMSGHVDAVSLTLLQGRPPVGHPKEPPDGDDSGEKDGAADTDQGPASTSPREHWRFASFLAG